MDAAPSHWVHDLSPFLIQFTETWGIRYYGLAYAMGFLLGGWLIYLAAKSRRLPLPPAAISDLMTALIAGVLIGGRLGYVLLYEPSMLWQAPLQVIAVWDGGMASHGGFIGVTLAMWWYARRHQLPLFKLSDAVIAVTPLGLGLGRVANFINGELWGRVTDVAWAVIFPASARPGTPLAYIEPRHPSQLYAAALEGFLIFGYLQWRYWRTPVATTTPGRLTAEFLILYAIGRIITEQFREPDASLMLGLTRGTFYSLFVLLAGGVIWWRSTRAPATGADA